jgi:hypothetical protein
MSEQTEEVKVAIEEVEKVKPSWFWIKNSKGEASVSVTFLTIAFAVTTVAYVGSMFEHIGPVAMRPFDVGACSTYFIPLLTLYFSRKFTDAKFGSK